MFICQDSDDDISAPIEMDEKFLLKSIHHAGLPEDIAMQDFEYEDSWKIGVKEFEKAQKTNQNLNA